MDKEFAKSVLEHLEKLNITVNGDVIIKTTDSPNTNVETSTNVEVENEEPVPAKINDPLEDWIIPEILDYFDFEKVQKVMELLKWEWAGIDGIPSVEEVKDVAINLVREAYNRKTTLYTAGFRATYVSAEDAAARDGYTLDEVEFPSIELEFIVENWDTTPVNDSDPNIW